LWLFVLAAGKLGFSIPGAQTTDQHQRRNLNKSKHGLPCFVVLVSCSAKLSPSFLKQYYNSQNVAESELDILDTKSLEGQGALFVLWPNSPAAVGHTSHSLSYNVFFYGFLTSTLSLTAIRVMPPRQGRASENLGKRGGGGNIRMTYLIFTF